MKKTRFYGGLDFNCKIYIEITEHDSFKRLSISGVIFERDEETGWGQIREKVKDIIPARLYQIWERWHLNDMRAGTFVQEEILRQAKDKGADLSTYEKACDYLHEFDVLVDDGYKYGSAWLKEELPQEVIDYLSVL
jgi:hypothetical protein